MPRISHQGNRALGPLEKLRLVNLEAVDAPEGFDKVLRVGSDVILARGAVGRALAVGVPDVAGPDTAKGRVKDNLVVLEGRGNVARQARGKAAARVAPAEGLGAAADDVGGNLGAGKEPDGDAPVSPLHGIDAATNSIETVTVVLVVASLLTTAVLGVAFVADDKRVGHGSESRHLAFVLRVQSNRVLSLRVDTLDDVDFARGRPVGTKHPKGRPDTASVGRHVGNVGNEEAFGKCLLRFDANGTTTVGRVMGGRIDAHVDGTVANSTQASSLGCWLIDKLDEALGRVGLVEVGELLEKVGGIVDRVDTVGGLGDPADKCDGDGRESC